MKNQKGITLVALIITIIVMLILVGVSVAVLVNSDIIGKTKEAGNAYNNVDNLSDLGTRNIIEGNKSVNDYLEAVQ